MNEKSRHGLTVEEVERSRSEHGWNILTPPKRTSMWKLYLDKYRDPIIEILLVAAAISLVLAFIEHDFVETLGIFLAIFLATTVGFYFERDASKKFDILNAMGEEQPVKVRRDGHVMKIARKEVVVGDIIIVETGDEVPADATLIDALDLQIDESSLTGEPICNKSVDKEKHGAESTYPADMLLRSTMVMSGKGEARVFAVGDSTEIGKVARTATEDSHVQTPLNQQLNKLASLISKVGSAISILVFVSFLIHDIIVNDRVWGGHDYLLMAQEVLKYFMMAVTLIVMAVPEGLPMAVTLSLALNMKRMLKSNILVRKLHACETMGAVTVVCTDKTGTLTQNKMQVADMRYEGDKALMATAIAVNSTAELNGDKGIGNPTEVALLLWIRQQGFDYDDIRQKAKVEHQVSFSTERKYMSTTVLMDGQRHTFVKGAPEIVMDMCGLDAESRQKVQDVLTGYQQKAMRTLAFACDDKFQGVAAIADPLRPEVPDAVHQVVGAGIEVKIVTGDTAATAIEIGRQIGIWNDDTPSTAVITGPEWAALSDDEAYQRAATLKIMARARPTDKLRLVEVLQKRGEVVAVTGDGTNDAPAQHHAQVGLSLGSGTSVAKEASDMTLIDDSFNSIADAVMWGRSLYKNIQRFLYFQLVVNVSALLLVLFGSIVGTEMPLTVTQILWVNLIMDTFAALALASLPPSHEVMKDRPRNQSAFIINKSMAWHILLCGAFFFAIMFVFLLYCERNGSAGIDRHELSLFFTTFVMLQFWNLFNAKTLGSHHSAFRHLWLDRGLLLVLVIIFIGQVIIVTFGGDMFRTCPLTIREWVIITALTSLVMWVGEFLKLIERWRR